MIAAGRATSLLVLLTQGKFVGKSGIPKQGSNDLMIFYEITDFGLHVDTSVKGIRGSFLTKFNSKFILTWSFCSQYKKFEIVSLI